METQTKLTHWKVLHHPDYIGAYALTPGQDMILTIKNVVSSIVTGTDGKKEELMVIHFMEPGVKPMICNKTNAKTITKIHKTPYIEQWSGKQIQLYAAPVSAFGTTTDALRIRDYVNAPAMIDPTKAIMQVNAAKSIDELKEIFTKRLTPAEQSHPEVKARVEQLKTTLK